MGESGCGKSVTAFSIMRLLPIPPAKIVAGEILFRGRDLLGLDDAAMRAIRAKEIAMIFQEPMTSLNPVYSVGEQIAEVVRLHERLGRRGGMERAVEMLQARAHSRTPSAACATIRTSSPAACASG